MLSFRKPKIEFLCKPEDEGVLAPPMPAKEAMPEWFKRLPAVDRNHLTPTNTGLTVKRCMPFVDALSAGWIIPLAATVRLEILDGGSTVKSGWQFDREMVSNHGAHQVAGNPREPRPPCKFHNYWTIRTPPGWSCLFVPPLNRPNGVVEIVSGVVDTDTYASLIHFPFLRHRSGRPPFPGEGDADRSGHSLQARNDIPARVRAGGNRGRCLGAQEDPAEHAGSGRMVPEVRARPPLTVSGRPRSTPTNTSS